MTVTVSDFVGCVSAGGPFPIGAACRREICVHTAVKRRKEMQQERRSMAGTTLMVASSARRFLFEPPPWGIAPPPMVSSLSRYSWKGREGRLLDRLFDRDLAHGHLHLVLVGHDQVQDAHRRLVDVVDHVLGTSLQDRVEHQGGDGDREAEGRA